MGEPFESSAGVRGLRDRVDQIIEERLADPHFTVHQMADLLGMSRTRLHRLARRRLGTSPGRMLRCARLTRSAKLLLSTDQRVGRIAREVGYPDPAHFTRSFKRRFGVTPTTYREAVPRDA